MKAVWETLGSEAFGEDSPPSAAAGKGCRGMRRFGPCCDGDL